MQDPGLSREIVPRMAGSLQPSGVSGLPVAPGRSQALTPETMDLIMEGRAENTRRAYKRHFATYLDFCQEAGLCPIPATPETLAEFARYLCQDREYAPRSVDLAIAAVRSAHRWSGFKGHPDTDLAKLVLTAYRRRRAESGRRNTRQSLPITIPTLRQMLGVCDLETPRGLRDRLLLVLGLALMGRRSELVALTIDDISLTEEGLVVLIRTSKTDRNSEGRSVPIPRGSHPITDPVRAFQDWTALLADHGITTGRLLRSVDRHGNLGRSLSTDAVNDIIRGLAEEAEIPNADQYTAHSLRAGGATAAYAAGNPVKAIAEHGRWDPKSTVVLQYIRAVDAWKDNPMRNVGL